MCSILWMLTDSKNINEKLNDHKRYVVTFLASFQRIVVYYFVVCVLYFLVFMHAHISISFHTPFLSIDISSKIISK